MYFVQTFVSRLQRLSTGDGHTFLLWKHWYHIVLSNGYPSCFLCIRYLYSDFGLEAGYPNWRISCLSSAYPSSYQSSTLKSATIVFLQAAGTALFSRPRGSQEPQL